MDRIAIAAQSEAPVVLVSHAPGDARDLAHTLHERGPRRDGPFVVVPCASLAQVMLASELRAVGGDDRDGWFAAASGGTIVIDGIESLPIPAQLNLVRVLDEPHLLARTSAVRGPLGVRVITTSRRPLSEHVARGALLESLLYRVASIVLRVPEAAVAEAAPWLETGS